MFELLSEINQVGDINGTFYNIDALHPVPNWDKSFQERIYSAYNSEYQHRVNTYLWQKEMAEYIKNDLMHRNHILTCSYAGPIKDDDGSDLTFSIPELDIISFNYSFNGNMNFMEHYQSLISDYHNQYNKPVIFSETGPLDEIGCDNGITYVQQLWQTAFTGVAGFNYWTGRQSGFEPQWQEMIKLKSWILNDPQKTNLLLGNWKVGHEHSEKINGVYYRKEMNYFINSFGNNASFAFGGLLNLTDNYFTNGNIGSSCVDNTIVNSSNFQSAFVSKLNLAYNNAPVFPWPVFDAATQWYNLNLQPNLGPVYSEAPSVAFTGFPHPFSCISGSCLSQFDYQSIFPFESNLFFHEDPTWISNSLENDSINDNIILNQKDDFLEITLNESISELDRNKNTNSIFTVKFYNLMGQLVREDNLDRGKNSKLDISSLPTGIYFITFTDNINNYSMRWLKY